MKPMYPQLENVEQGNCSTNVFFAFFLSPLHMHSSGKMLFCYGKRILQV